MTPRRVPGLRRRRARARGRDARRERLETVIGLLHLEPVLDQAIETLSKGFKRRVGLAQAILHDPRGADPRRADRRPRSQPEARGARADPLDGGGQADRHLDAHPRGGRRGVHARDHHRRRAHAGRRHAGRARGPRRRRPRPSVPGHHEGRGRRRHECSDVGRSAASSGATSRRRSRTSSSSSS